MRSSHGFQAAILDALPDAPPGLPAIGVREVLEIRCVRAPSIRTVRDSLQRLRREGMVRVRRERGHAGRWWRS